MRFLKNKGYQDDMSLRHTGSYNNICNPGFKYELDSLWPYLGNKQVCETRKTLGSRGRRILVSMKHCKLHFNTFFVQLLLV